MFSSFPLKKFNFSAKFSLSSANALNLDQSKSLLFCKALTLYHTTPRFNNPEIDDFLEKKCQKEENAGSQLFLLSLNVFSLLFPTKI